MTTRIDRILAMAARDNGVSRSEVRGTSKDYAGAVADLERLAADGVVFRAAVAKGRERRFFATAEAAQAWVATKAVPPPIKRRGDPMTGRAGANWRGKSAQQQPVEHAGPPRLTICPSRPDTRYSVDPNTRVLGGFAALGSGRYLDGNA